MPAMMGSETDLVGAYRFFNNPKVTPESLLFQHRAATLRRAQELQEWVCIHDTTEMDYSGSRVGLGPLAGSRRGFLAHCSLAAGGPDLLPLGLLNLELVTRKEAKRGKGKKSVKPRRRSKFSFGPENEHSRWERGLAAVETLAKAHGLRRPINLLDCEADSYLQLAQMLQDERRFVCRMNHDRALTVSPGSRGPRRVSEALRSLPCLLERDITISKRQPKLKAPDALRKHPPRHERDVHLELTATRIVLKRPHNAPDWIPPQLELNVVRAYEPHPPPGEEPVEWRLMTTEPIDSQQAIARVVDLYRMRWLIEEFFKALKSGCAVLDREFENASALQNVLAMSIPFAWQMLALRTLAHRDHGAPSTAVLSPRQVQLTVAASQRLPPRQRPPSKPTALQALLAIAALGGHIKSNGEPGWLTLARGFIELRKLEAAIALLTASSPGEDPAPP